MSPPVFLADPARLGAAQITLDGAEGRHAATVRRLRAGERVDLTDGRGRWVECVVAEAARDALTLDVLTRHRYERPRPRLTVVQALPKGDRGELAVETMTEVGVDEIVPWSAARSITQWKPDRREKSLAKWRSAAREAAKQARRSWHPEIADLASTPQVEQRVAGLGRGGGGGRALVLHEAAQTPLSSLTLPEDGEILMIVGPEGGICDEELSLFAAAGALPVLLGPTVLRTSTAGVAAASVLLAATGRW